MPGGQETDAEDFVQLVEQAWERRAEERNRTDLRPPITPEVVEEDEAGCE